MRLKVSNRQRALRPDPERIRNLLAYFWTRASVGEGPDQGRKPQSRSGRGASRLAPPRVSAQLGEIQLLLTDDSGIIRVNQSVFEKSGTTDVITLAYPALPGQASGRAEIFVNVEPAMREGARRAGTACELALYVAHGCDHLAGGRDDTPARRRRMLERERRWVLKAKELGLLAGLCQHFKRGC